MTLGDGGDIFRALNLGPGATSLHAHVREIVQSVNDMDVGPPPARVQIALATLVREMAYGVDRPLWDAMDRLIERMEMLK